MEVSRTRRPAPTLRRPTPLEDRMTEFEHALIKISVQMDFLCKQAEEQRDFRQRCYWAGGAAIALLVLQSLGFDVSVVK